MKKLAILTLTFVTLMSSAQAVNIGDLENARGYSYMYRMNGQQYYADNRVIVRAGEGNNYEIIAKTYSHQGAMYYMTEYINHYYFNQDEDTIYWTQDEINLIDARTGQILRRNIKKNPKLKELKPDTYGYMQAIYSKNMAIAAGQLKEVSH
ncbi:hypothetical protein [Veillonella tobetsuensis]|uniref:Surface layer protein A domain-containing protein n=1 Tax=Veillonella tobetsuensis TaxID=1110546 RepID=A0A480B9M5_9FIRM|nr:hypothetical protein [Veillonella tobetsuensis]GCL68595.1 hypothetical protein PAGU1579_03640 [Veillonella tobetsuensis]